MSSTPVLQPPGAATLKAAPGVPPAELLSAREREVLRHLAQGCTYASIARAMGLSPHTVDTYLRRIRAKTGAHNRIQLALLAADVCGLR